MATMIVEISDELKMQLDQLASGPYANSSAVVQDLLEFAIQAKWKENFERMIDEGIDAVERGEVTTWKKGDLRAFREKVLKERKNGNSST